MNSATRLEHRRILQKVLAYIEQNLDSDLCPRQLAGLAGFSSHHFHRIFRTHTGESVMDYIRKVRLQKAAERLRSTEEPVGVIALLAGYNAHEAFTRAFRSLYGEPPVAFRLAFASVPAGPVCGAHREMLDVLESGWERVMRWASSLAEMVYPPGFAAKERMMSNVLDVDKEISELEESLEATKQKLAEARRRRPREEVGDYEFQTWDGRPVHLSELFGDKDDLILIHNMGTGCSYCTLWADGFNGLVPHLEDRAAFVLASPDKPEIQKRFAERRGWRFRCVSANGTSFYKDMGFEGEDGSPWPGVSTFRRENGKIFRIAKAPFGPGDDFCVVWPFLDLLEDGAKGWEPKYEYKG